MTMYTSSANLPSDTEPRVSVFAVVAAVAEYATVVPASDVSNLYYATFGHPVMYSRCFHLMKRNTPDDGDDVDVAENLWNEIPSCWWWWWW